MSRDEKWLLGGVLLFVSFSLIIWWGIKYSLFQSTFLSSQVEEFLNQTFVHMGIGEENIAEKFSEEKDGKVVIYETIVIPRSKEFVEKLSRRLRQAHFSLSLQQEGRTFILSVGKGSFKTHIIRFKSREKSSLSTTKKPYLVVVIDDIGYGGEGDNLVLTLPSEVTLSFLPRTPHAKELSRQAREKGFEILLHQPLEGRNVDPYPNPGVITCSMSKEEMREILNNNLTTVEGIVGINNHEGSVFTSRQKPMEELLSLVKGKDLFFLDSLTTSGSQVEKVAQQFGIPVLKRDIFLDNKKDPAYIHNQFQKLLSIAHRKGYAIAIGHSRAVTIETLKKELARNKDKVRLVHLSFLLKDESP